MTRLVREADASLRRSSPSIPLGDERHAAVGVFDAGGAALAVSRPAWLASLAASVRSVLDTFGGTLGPGDVAATNDPFAGGTHVHDVTVVRPAADLYLAARFHTADVAGERIGSVWPAATEIWQEGVRLLHCAWRAASAPTTTSRRCLPSTAACPTCCAATSPPRPPPSTSWTWRWRRAACPRRPRCWTEPGPEWERRSRGCATGAGRPRGGSATAAPASTPFELRLTVGDGRVAFAFPVEPAGVDAFVNSPEAATRSALLAPLAATLPDAACNAALLEAVDVATTPGSLFAARPPRPTAYAPYITAGALAAAAAELLGRAGLAAAPFEHWFALPARVFALPWCDDPACPFHRWDDRDTHRTRYAPEARS
ncbi:MAG: hydantoinase B/oxoprolinase family protein [Solirubrobacteraceae bacterium]